MNKKSHILMITILSILLAVGFVHSMPSFASFSCPTNSGTQFCAFGNGSGSKVTLNAVAIFMASSGSMSSCKSTGVNCNVFGVTGNELQQHLTPDTADKAAYNQYAHKTYEYTYIDETHQTSVTFGTFLGQATYSTQSNNVYWNMVAPDSTQASSYCLNIKGTCDSTQAEFGITGGYLGTASDGVQFFAQILDCRHSSIQANTQSCPAAPQGSGSASNDPNAMNGAPTLGIVVNANEERHSLYWLVVDDSTTSGTITNGENAHSLSNDPSTMNYAGMSLFYDSTSNKYQAVFFMASDSGTLTKNPEADITNGGSTLVGDTGIQLVGGAAHYTYGGTGNSYQNDMEWAAYSAPSTSYTGAVSSLNAYYNCNSSSSSCAGSNVHGTGQDTHTDEKQGGTNVIQGCLDGLNGNTNTDPQGCSGEFGHSATNGGTDGNFYSGDGNDYSFDTIGAHISIDTTTGVISFDQVCDTASQYTTGVVIP